MTKSVTTAAQRGISILRRLLFLGLLATPVLAQVVGTTNTLDNVALSTPMWSLADPFAFQATSNLQTRVSGLEATNSIASAVSNVVRYVEYEPGKFRLFFTE